MIVQPLREGGPAARIAVIPGDGIGKEVTPEAVKAMKHVARFIDTSMRDNGIEAISGKAG